MSMSEEVITINDANGGSLVNITNMRIDDEVYYEDSDDEDGDEDEEQAPVVPHVELGLVEKMLKYEWSVLGHSKAGGTPAWLKPINLPSGKSCLCDICGQPLHFLLQIYAPLSDKESESTYHRTLYVFMCTSMSCLLQDQPEKASRSIKVFRCQLPHHNQFYSDDKPLGTAAPFCSWCGTWKGDKVCSNCKSARYCSKAHQVIHWTSTHKKQCRTIDPSNNCLENIPKAASNYTWQEFEITFVHESKSDSESKSNSESESDSEMSNINEYGNALRGYNEDDDDATSWANFTQGIARKPDQVLMYSRHSTSEPLWPKLSGRPSKADIPKCSSCGSDRAFEFQIMPQLLYFLQVKDDSNSLDWTTIVVYTCEGSCDGSQSYEEEFSWVQL